MLNKKLLLLIFTIILLFNNNLIYALEVKLPGLEENPTLGDYVSYIFTILLTTAGVLSLISFVIGAIGLMNPNIEAHNEAKDRMKGAVLGLILTLSSFVILQTINTQFITIKPSSPETLAGVFLTNGTDDKPCPFIVSDTTTLPEGYNQIKYNCPETTGTPPALLVWLFPNAGLENNNDLTQVRVNRMECNSTLSIGNFHSFSIAFETPGVYFYLDSGCTTYGSQANTSSQNMIPEPFKGKMQGVKIVNDPNNPNIKFGVIFHKTIGLENGGLCSEPIGTEGCNSVDIEAYAVDIFNINQDTPPYSSGDGVVFYSASFEDAVGARAGKIIIKNEDISSDLQPNNVPLGKFNWEGISRTQAYKDYCDAGGISACPGSMDIKGNYLVGLYSTSRTGEGYYCQTFVKSVPNFLSEPITSESETMIEKIYIIPLGAGG